MRLHPAFGAVTALVLGISAVSFAAALSVSRPTPRPVKILEAATPSSLPSATFVDHVKELAPLNLITLPEVKIEAALRLPTPKPVEYVERCREVYLDQGATEGKTVMYCEKRRKEDLP